MSDSIENAIKELYRAEPREDGVAVIKRYDDELLCFIPHNPTFVNPEEHAMGEAYRRMRQEVEPVHRSIHGHPDREQV